MDAEEHDNPGVVRSQDSCEAEYVRSIIQIASPGSGDLSSASLSGNFITGDVRTKNADIFLHDPMEAPENSLSRLRLEQLADDPRYVCALTRSRGVDDVIDHVGSVSYTHLTLPTIYSV